MLKQSRFIFAITLVICMAAEACAQSSGRAEVVRIAYPSRGVTVLPLRIPQVQGLFHQENLEAELIQMKAGITVVALTTGDLDYGAPTRTRRKSKLCFSVTAR